MRFSLTTTLGALAVSLALAPGWASAWEKIKLTTSPYCTPMIIMVTSGKTSKVSMVLLLKTVVDEIRKQVAAKGGSLLLLSGGDY